MPAITVTIVLSLLCLAIIITIVIAVHSSVRETHWCLGAGGTPAKIQEARVCLNDYTLIEVDLP